jgi:hypothetical protein
MQTVFGIGKAQSGTEFIFQKTIPVAGKGTLFLDTAIGTVDVRTTQTDVVTIHITPQIRPALVDERDRLLANLDIEATQQQNDVRVTARFRRETPDDDRRHVRLHFEVSVPQHYNLELSTVGSVVSGDLQGDVKVETAGGSLNFGDIGGALTVDSAGGSITAGRVGGPIKVLSDGGRVSLKEVLDSITAETGGGSFKAYLSQRPGSDSTVSTSAGRIEMRLAQTAGVELDALSTGGRVQTNDPTLTDPCGKLNTLRTTINGGGPKLVLRAEGSIFLRTQP